jgi:hypothetical protein
MGKIALAAALLLTAGLLYRQRDWPRHWRLYKHGVAASGWVTGKSDGPDKLVHYAFATPLKTFTGSGEADYGNPSYDALSPDDQVVVYYLPENPDVSCLGDPKARLREQHAAMVWILLPGLAAAAYALRGELKRASA